MNTPDKSTAQKDATSFTPKTGDKNNSTVAPQAPKVQEPSVKPSDDAKKETSERKV